LFLREGRTFQRVHFSFRFAVFGVLEEYCRVSVLES
jgi:hypothetical protein